MTEYERLSLRLQLLTLEGIALSLNRDSAARDQKAVANFVRLVSVTHAAVTKAIDRDMGVEEAAADDE